MKRDSNSGTTAGPQGPAPVGVPSLRRAVIFGSAWMVGMRWSIQLIAMVNTIVLARLLSPNDFGLVAMASVVAGFATILFELGVNMALIQNPRATRDHFNAAWTIRVMQSVAAAVLMIASAPLAAMYYDDRRVIPILAIVGVSTMIRGFSNIGVVAFSKDLQFGWEYAFRVSAKVLSVVATIVLAMLLRNYWALVLGALTASLLHLVLSYRVHPFRPRFGLKAAGEIWSYSQWMVVNQIANYLTWRVDRFVIGGVTTARGLGLYSVGGELAELPSAQLVAPLSRSLTPGFAKLREHPQRLRTAFLNSLGATVAVGIPAGIGMVVVAPILVPLALGEKWADAVGVVQILSIYAVTRAFFSTGANLGYVTGQIKKLASFAVIRGAIFLSSIYWAFQWAGIEGVAWAKLGIGAVNAVVVNAIVCRANSVRASEFLKSCWRPAAASAMMALVLVRWLSGLVEEPILATILLVTSGVAVYLGTLWLLWAASGFSAGIERTMWKMIVSRLGSRADPSSTVSG